MEKREEDLLEEKLKSLGESETDFETEKNIPEPSELNLEKMINKRIRNICLKTIGIVVLAVAVVFAGISPLMKAAFLNPVKMEKNDYAFMRYMRAYYEMRGPYVEVMGAEAEYKGFSKYEVSLGLASQMTGSKDSLQINRAFPVVLTIDKGKLTKVQDGAGALTFTMGRFACDWNVKEEIIAEIEKLPESTYLSLSVGEKEPRPVKEHFEEDICAEWAEIYNPVSDFQGGMSLDMAGMWKETDDRKSLSEEELRQVFLDNLELLLTEPKLLRSLGIYSGSTEFFTLEVVEKTRDYFRENKELLTKNYCLSGTKEQVLAYLEQHEFTSIKVDDVRLSILE